MNRWIFAGQDHSCDVDLLLSWLTLLRYADSSDKWNVFALPFAVDRG
jgi:hypothetical protein